MESYYRKREASAFNFYQLLVFSEYLINWGKYPSCTNPSNALIVYLCIHKHPIMIKTTIQTAFFTLLSCTAIAQQTVSWGPEISVADGSVYGNVHPRMTLAADGSPLVVFGHATQGKLYVAKGNGAGFNTPVVLFPQTVQAYLANWTGPDITAYADTVVVIFKAKPFDVGHIYAVRSTDGGLTFSDTIRVDDHNSGRTFLPSVKFDMNGNPVVSYMTFDDFADLNPQYVIAHSPDGGQTYGASIPVSPINGAEACDCCPSDLVVNGSNQALLYRNNDANIRDIFGILSTDNGQNFTTSENLENLSWNLNACPSTGPQGCTLGSRLVSVAASAASGDYRVYLSAVDWADLQNPAQFTLMPPTNATGKQNYPRISAAGDTVVVVWEERETSNPEVFCAVITNGDLSGLDDYKAQINTVATGTQTNPDVIVKDGFVHVVFQDAASGDVIYRKGTITDVAGVEQLSAEQIRVYPNPSENGQFYVVGITNANLISITDISGKVIPFRYSTSGSDIQIELPVAEKGIYLLSGENGLAKTLIVH